MGEALYAQLSEDRPDIACRTYAPVGSHRDLLAYLVRRLLENGANSSFVAVAADDSVPVATLLRRPADIIGTAGNARHPNIRAAARSLSAASGRIRAASNSAMQRGAATRAGFGRSPARRPRPAAAKHRRSRRPDAGRTAAIGRGARAGSRRWSRTPARRARATILRTGRRSAGAAARAFHRAAADARAARPSTMRSPRCARPSISAATTPREGRKLFGDGEPLPGPTGESNRAAAARPRRLRRDLAVELSAGDLSGPGGGGADGRQRGGGKARRTDAADRGGGRAPAASRPACPPRRCISCPATAASARRWSRIPTSPASSSPARPRSRASINRDARRQGRPDRAADRGDRRHQRDDRRRHRAARAGRRRRRDLGVPLGRPALLGAAPAVRAGRRRRPHDRDDRGRRPRTADRRSRATSPPMSGR